MKRLSFRYPKKRTNEKKESNKREQQFNWALVRGDLRTSNSDLARFFLRAVSVTLRIKGFTGNQVG